MKLIPIEPYKVLDISNNKYHDTDIDSSFLVNENQIAAMVINKYEARTEYTIVLSAGIAYSCWNLPNELLEVIS